MAMASVAGWLSEMLVNPSKSHVQMTARLAYPVLRVTVPSRTRPPEIGAEQRGGHPARDPELDRHGEERQHVVEQPLLVRREAAAPVGDQPANGGCGTLGRHLRQFVRELALADD
jgi:hypothetical protein